MEITGDGVISQAQMTQQLRALGVMPGGVLLVHCAFSQVKPVEDGPLGLIAALQAAVGEDGTLVMPGMTDDDDMGTRAVVDTVVAQLRENEIVFLHPLGVDEECDEARASLASQ